MPTFAVHYAYDDRSAERDALRPEHRAYLDQLAARGVALAFARYDDDGAPGALLVFQAPDAVAVEHLLAEDPFVIAGLVVSHDVRHWPAIGPWAS